LRLRRLDFLLLLGATFAGSCAAPKTPPRLPAGEDYVFPLAQPGELRPEEARRIETAWRDVLMGETSQAERQSVRLLREHPGLVPAETLLAYAQMRGGQLAAAAASFESVLVRRADYFPALMGAASLAAHSQEMESAFELYRRALAAFPQDAVARRRLGETKLQVTERLVASGRGALEAGDLDAAIACYQRALETAPEVGGVRVELANLLVKKGDNDQAIAVLEADGGQDRQVLNRLGEILVDLKEYQRALQAYRQLLQRDPKDAEAARHALEIRSTLEFLQMPEEYRRIAASPRITRADLAALLSVKVTALSKVTPGEARVAVDISGSWARDHIIKALSLDIMDVYPNHTFQPGAIVRRGDLAQAMGRILDLLKWPQAPGPALKDVSPNNLVYAGAVRAVGTGLMDLTPDGAFEAWRPVSGQEAAAIIEGLTRLVGP